MSIHVYAHPSFQNFRLGPFAHLQFTGGALTNKIATDTQQFPFVLPPVLKLLTLSLYIIAAVAYLWDLFGTSSIAGIMVMVASMTAASCISKSLQRLRADKAEVVKARSEVVGHAVQNIRSVKSNTFETAVEESVDNIWAHEATLVRKRANLQLFNISLNTITPPVAVLTMMLLWSTLSTNDDSQVSDNLSLASTFTALTLISMLQGLLMEVLDDITPCRQVRNFVT